MSYLGELRTNWKPLLAASLGVGTSLPFDAYTNSIFAPYLLEEFGWSRAQFALYGLTVIVAVIALPFVGRLTDRYGVRPVALVGTLLMPVIFFGYSQMQGSFTIFLILSALKLSVAQLTSHVVYTRLIAENFHLARGLALTIVNCTPAALGAMAAPILTWSIETYGWRFSYPAVATFSLVCGIIALMLISNKPAAGVKTVDMVPHDARSPSARDDFALITRSRVFWIIIAGFFLCMLASPLQSSQLNIMLKENGLVGQTAALVVSIYAISNICGRIACGLALDRFSTPIVTAVSMIPPALGFFLLAGPVDTVAIIAFSMILVGLTVGAENDLISFLIARYFNIRIYSSALSLLMGALFLTTATASLTISASLKFAGSFAPYLYLLSGTVLIGSLLFLLLPKSRDFAQVGGTTEEPAERKSAASYSTT